MTLMIRCFPPNYLQADDFPRGDKHSRYVSLLTYLAWLQPINNNSRLIFNHGKIKKVLLVVKTLIKQHKVVTTLIRSHFNELSIVVTNLASYLNLSKSAPSKNISQNCFLKNTLQNCSLKKYISKQLMLTKSSFCLTKNVVHSYLVCQICTTLIINH